VQDILNEVWGGEEAAGATAEAAAGAETGAGEGGGEGERSAFQVYREIERVIAERVRPVLQRDGGDIELVDIKGWRVYCSLKGRCAGCLGASRTLQLIVERSLKDGVDERIRVIPV
jgi:NifU-like protein